MTRAREAGAFSGAARPSPERNPKAQAMPTDPNRKLAALFAPALAALCCIAASAPAARAQNAAPPATFAQTLAEARARSEAKEWKEAAALWAKVTEANPVEGRFWGELATARYNARDYAGAIRAYEKALELRSGHPADSAYNIACCYALAGDREQALRWLEKAFAMGFRHLRLAQTDEDLKSLREDPRYRRLVALVDTSRMSRDEGWRYDLGLLAREVRRKGYADGIPRRLPLAEFDALVRRLDADIPRLTDTEVIIELMKLMARLGDGHTGLLGSPERADLRRTLPLQFYLFEEGLFVVSADPKYRELLGAQVLGFDGSPVERVVASLAPLISRDNEIWVRQRAPYMMRHLPLLRGLGVVSDAARVRLAVRDTAGRERAVTVEADETQPNIWNTLPNPAAWVNYPQTLAAPLPLYLRNMAAPYWFEYLPEAKAVYFQFNSVRNDPAEPFARFVERLFKFVSEHDVERLVVDMRWNNGGNTLLEPPLVEAVLRSDKINRRGRLFVVVGRRTYSAAQNGATFLERHTQALFVGEPTGSSPNFVGEETVFTLPYSRLLANVSDLYWQSSWPFDYRTWLAPQLYAPPTFAAFRENRDPALEAALSYREGP